MKSMGKRAMKFQRTECLQILLGGWGHGCSLWGLVVVYGLEDDAAEVLGKQPNIIRPVLTVQPERRESYGSQKFTKPPNPRISKRKARFENGTVNAGAVFREVELRGLLGRRKGRVPGHLVLLRVGGGGERVLGRQAKEVIPPPRGNSRRCPKGSKDPAFQRPLRSGEGGGGLGCLVPFLAPPAWGEEASDQGRGYPGGEGGSRGDQKGSRKEILGILEKYRAALPPPPRVSRDPTTHSPTHPPPRGGGLPNLRRKPAPFSLPTAVITVAQSAIRTIHPTPCRPIVSPMKGVTTLEGQ